ncbi:MAG: AbrB/MazE/SpoVT family DNA-binding domain-containing protein [Chloroflexi bacterium]|nr:AbrB/MazE/SpoVT family DNA-binding domain-containing protein [Chloroflexota bacterium]
MYAEKGQVQSLTVSSKGQITISADARRRLSIRKGTHLLEVVVGDCLLYVPEDTYLSQILATFQDGLKRTHLTAEEIAGDIESHKGELFQSLYPELADE